MNIIASLTVVTEAGVQCFFKSDGVQIVSGKYVADGDLYDCFRIFKDDKKTHEIRCVRNVIIEYEEVPE